MSLVFLLLIAAGLIAILLVALNLDRRPRNRRSNDGGAVWYDGGGIGHDRAAHHTSDSRESDGFDWGGGAEADSSGGGGDGGGGGGGDGGD